MELLICMRRGELSLPGGCSWAFEGMRGKSCKELEPLFLLMSLPDTPGPAVKVSFPLCVSLSNNFILLYCCMTAGSKNPLAA